LRSAIEAKDRADQDITRISEELRLYKLQLDAAQKEIFRAQDVLQMVEKQKYDAELDAAKARTTARDLLEEKTIMIAREEGRKLGYKDGLRRGRTLGYEEGRSVGYEDGQAYSQRLATPDIYDEENEPPEEEYDERTKSPPRSLVLDISRPPSTQCIIFVLLIVSNLPYLYNLSADHGVVAVEGSPLGLVSELLPSPRCL
jgi:hypothetical protein